MFTGIVEEVGRLSSTQDGDLTIAATVVLEDTKIGDSIAVNGACLTVTALGPDYFVTHTVPETLRLTNLGDLETGGLVNLERAMAFGSRVDGHLVQGHIEGTGELRTVTPDGPDSVRVTYHAPAELLPYIVTKGFIAVDGVSLTVVDVSEDAFSIALIPYTKEHTNLADKRPGNRVNLETDIIARYLERYMQSGLLRK